MKRKSVIFIDNEDQTEEIEAFKRKAGNKGIMVDCEQFKVGSTEMTEVLNEGKIDIQKVINTYQSRFWKKRFDLAAFDYDLSDDDIDGIELIRKFKENKILKNGSKLVYSGLLNQIIKDKLKDYKNNHSTLDDTEKYFRALINTPIDAFIERGSHFDAILSKLEKMDEEDGSPDIILEEELAKLPDMQFTNNFFNSNFQNKTYQEVLDIIDEDPILYCELKRELIKLGLAQSTNEL